MIEDNKNNPLIEFSDQIRAVEALLFAASDPLDEKTLKDMLPVGSAQILKTQIARDGEDAKGKFGRILGDFIVHYTPEDRQTKASEIMILEGYAVAYHGQNKEDVEQEHLNNRERLIKEKKVVL